MPAEIIEGLTFEKVEKQSQTRRSKIQDEVLVMLETSQQRDVIQSFATNLAAVQGKAGMRLDIPDHLRGLFRLFEAHAAALRAEYGTVKRAIRFDDMNASLYMDVKLEDTEWHRITDEEMRTIQEKNRTAPPPQKKQPSKTSVEEKNRILMQSQRAYPQVESECDE